MLAYRIGDANGRYPIFSAAGAARVEGRWHERGQSVTYASEHYSTALLEKLAHFSGVLPDNQHYIEITIPAGVSYEVVTKDKLPDWTNASKARIFGARWLEEQRSTILIVPSIVARIERNIVINAASPEFSQIKADLEIPVTWDDRLFS